ncbi:MAG: SirB2 family protein [Oleibacter sp.]|nr:SirB2 family protein [Thalassolituus sp.]
MLYAAFKHSHIALVYLSLLLFVLRFAFAYIRPSLNQMKIFKVGPHAVALLLLITAGVLCVIIGQYPFEQAWVTAKFIGLFVYIILGLIAIKKQKFGVFILTLLTFAYLVGVARMHSALSWIMML